MHPRLRHLLLATTPLLAFGLTQATAGPEGASVVGGAATISGQGGPAVIVNQSTSSAVINWNTFNIRANESVRFNQPNSSSVALNRVVGGLGPSEIMGSLTANGRVFIINRDGILFGPGSVVNTAGFLATTNDIKNADFMAGRYNFNIPGRPDASIVNQGRITATSGGFAALVAPGVRNSGTITATLGTVALASGNSFTLDMYGDKLITLAVGDSIASKVIDVATGRPLKSLVSNTRRGVINANGGRVELTAAAARAVVDSVINTKGVIRADSIGRHNGMIVLNAATGGSKPAGAPAQTIKLAGTISAAGKHRGTTGGTIVVSGEHIKIANAKIDASGRRGGGKILIGGDWGGGHPDLSLVTNQSAKLENFTIATATTVSVDANSTINASATGRGHGGKVVLWSDNQTTFAGTILAKGGAKSGDGGFVEVSSHQLLNYIGTTDTRASRGTTGTLLLDPYDVFISNRTTSNGSINGGTFTPTGESSVLNATDLENALALSNIIVTTGGAGSPGTQAGDITVESGAHVAWSTGSTLTLSAYHNIIFEPGSSISNTGTGNLVMRADNSGTGSGTIVFPNSEGDRVNFSQSTGAVSILYNPNFPENPNQTKYQNPTDFSCCVSVQQSSQLMAYMLVNSAGDLNAVRTNTSGTYALGRDINASTFGNFAPIPTFNGLLEGLNHTISNLTIAPNNTTTQNIGLFGTIQSAGVVRNLNLENVTVNANAGLPGGFQSVGTLAGVNLGIIANVTATGSVNGGNLVGVTAGGLVGTNGTLGPDPVAGLITGSNAAVVVTLGSGTGCPGSCIFNAAGGLAGANVADSVIENSFATGNVIVGGSAWAGGLVGINGSSSSMPGEIVNSFATGNVFSDGVNVGLGGLVGLNSPGAIITTSFATGSVTSTASLPGNGTDCSSGSCQFAVAGGLVGQNFGTIFGNETAPTAATSCGAGQTCATGTVTVGSNGAGGGLAGFNNGIIFNAFATGNVAGSAGTGDQGRSTSLGGLVGVNDGLIWGSLARGNVGAPGVSNLQAGGLVGDNAGSILFSTATGNVQAGDGSNAGGLVGTNSTVQENCSGCMNGDGQMFFNSAVIGFSTATGNVSVGAASVAGGFAGTGNGAFFANNATGAVSGGGNSVLGGFIGAFTFADGPALIEQSTASGPVASTGANSIVGGFAGLTSGTIVASSAAGPVSGISDSYLGGFAGVNLGAVSTSSTAPSSTVTGTGDRNIIGGFFGANFGSISASSSAGNATGATNSAVGGFGGANATFVNFPGGSIPNSTFPVGTITNSAGTGTASSGQGSVVDPFVALNNPNSSSNPPAFPSIVGGCSDATCVFVNTGQLPPPRSTPDTPPTLPTLPTLPPFSPEFLESLAAQQSQIILNLTSTIQLAALGTPPVVSNIQGAIKTPSQPPPGASGAGAAAGRQILPGLERRVVDIPPPTETRLIQDEVVVQIASNVTPDRLQAAVRRLGLTVIASESLPNAGSTVVRLKITNGRTPAAAIQSMANVGMAAIVQPNYVYSLDQAGAEQAPATRGDPAQQQGDAAQYILEKLKMLDVHRMVRGANIPIAVIDSEIDFTHPDLVGVVAQRFSAVGGAPEKPHPHGTGMAGAMAARQRILGTAPAARLLAVHAFSSNAAKAESTTFNILKGIDWAVGQGARVINMSFAGPADPSLQRSLKLAYDKGIVLVAAAGNAGAKSPPLFPGADPLVIAVTATDVDDKLFTGANRGKYISVAAPGVDILVPAPENAYQLTTGTSVAAAEVSGIVALLLERNPKLTPADIRRILTASARRLGTGERDDNFGAGLIDPLKALQLAEPRTAATTPPPAPTPTLRQR